MIEQEREFEQRLAYFYNVDNPSLVAAKYIHALQLFSDIKEGDIPPNIQEAVLRSLEFAYCEIATQRGIRFDTRQAAMLEFQIIIGHKYGISFETVQQRLEELYMLVFQKKSSYIQKAAMLRAFLYQYKIDTLKREGLLLKEDMLLLLEIAEVSKRFLNTL